jgi:carbonic anhydrase
MVDGSEADVEAHFVHDPPLVLGVLLKASPVGGADAVLRAALENRSRVSLTGVRPGSLFEYTGSLTTPPCTEKVVWLVDSMPRSMARDQLWAFQRARGPVLNARPIQPVNGRRIDLLPMT